MTGGVQAMQTYFLLVKLRMLSLDVSATTQAL